MRMANQTTAVKTWHDKHAQTLTFSQKLADKMANGMGSWRFIITQSIVIILWIGLNIVAYINHWDPYPFILLNLVFSTQAAYSAPIIMMSQNRAAERDRFQANEDFVTNVQAKKEIEALQKFLARIEDEKLDKIIKLLEANR
jgi:uncharacterized membrane protein